MEDTDAFFTHTIVGPPVSVRIGRRVRTLKTVDGLQVDMGNARFALSDAWADWVVLSHANDRPGRPRRRPGPLRRWLERHALWLGALGLLGVLATVGYWLGHAGGWW